MALSNETQLEVEEEEEVTFQAVATGLVSPKSLSTNLAHSSLLRGVRFRSLVTGSGIHFKARNLASASFTEEESAELYATSQEVKVLDGFVSHTWRSSRIGKVLALLVATNMVAASIVSGLVAVIVAILIHQEVLPVVTLSYLTMEGSSFNYQFFPWVSFFGFFSFLISFRYWHLVPQLLLGLEKYYFFDKLCVHQFDEDRKIAGILSFAAYVRNAKEFLLLWDTNYCQRLWCTLELGALVKDHEQEDLPLVFLPLSLATTSFVAWLILILVHAISAINYSAGSPLPTTPVAFVLVVASYVALSNVTLRYMQQRIELSTQLTQFKVTQAVCFLERDREIVNRTLTEWFGSLDNFDEHVHTTVKYKVLSTIGREIHYPLKYTFPLFLIRLYSDMDFIAPGASGFWGQLQQADSLWMSHALGNASFLVVILTLLPACMHVAKVGVKVAAKVGEERWKTVVVLMAMTVANVTYTFSLYFILVHLASSFPAYIVAAILVLILLWFAWLQTDSFRKRRAPSAQTISVAQDATCGDQIAIGAGTGLRWTGEDVLEESKDGEVYDVTEV